MSVPPLDFGNESASDSDDDTPLPERIADAQAQLNSMRPSTAPSTMVEYLMCGLLRSIQAMVLNHFWHNCMTPIGESSRPDEIFRHLAYQAWLTEQLAYNELLDHAIKIRVQMFLAEIEKRVGPTVEHPMYTVIEGLMSFCKIAVKRTQKRQQPLATDAPALLRHAMQQDFQNGIVTDVWACNAHNVKDLQNHSEPVTDANNRPVTYFKEGKEKIVTQAKQNAIKGNDPRKLRSFVISPIPQDADPNAINSLAELTSEEQLNRVVDEWNGVLEPIGAGLPAPFQFLVPAGGPTLQLKGLHNFIHFREHVCQAVMGVLDGLEACPATWYELWIVLVGPKNAAFSSAAKFTGSKTLPLAAVIAKMRDILLANLRMMQCAGCSKFTNIVCTACPECVFTLRSCEGSPGCAAAAVAAHAKAHQPPGTEPARKRAKAK